MTAKNLEELFQATYLKPVHRGKIWDYSIYVGDGFVPTDELASFNRKFGPDVRLEKSEWVTFCMAEVGRGRYFVSAVSFDEDSAPALSERVKIAIEYATTSLKRPGAAH